MRAWKVIAAVAMSCAATAHSGQGWYLMIPPIEGARVENMQILFEAPLSRWINTRAYDRAAECERALPCVIARSTARPIARSTQHSVALCCGQESSSTPRRRHHSAMLTSSSPCKNASRRARSRDPLIRAHPVTISAPIRARGSTCETRATHQSPSCARGSRGHSPSSCS